jgi:adenine-specific DNA-methyltransferase
VKENRLWWGDQGTAKKPSFKRFLSEVEGLIPSTWWDWDECGHTDEAKKEVLDLFGDDAITFQTPKPSRLIKRILQISTLENDIVLDFFSGSGSLAQAVFELNREEGCNRQFVMVQLPEPTGNKQYPTIAEIGKERIRRVIAKLNKATGDLTRTTPEDLGFKVFALGESHFEQWAGVPDRDSAKYAATMDAFLDPIKPDADPIAILWELAVKEGYRLNSTTIAANVGTNTVYTVIDPEKDPPQTFRACLDEQLDPDIAKQLGLSESDLFICRDSALVDTLAANLALQCRLKTI